MEKMKCDIIQDLIPVYVDEICSEATRECVEEHIKNCKECRQVVALCRNHGLSGEKLEQNGLDGLKKIKQIGQIKGLVCCGLVLFLILCLGLNLFVFKKNVLPYSAHTIILVVCMILTLISGMGYTRRETFQGNLISEKKKAGHSGRMEVSGKEEAAYSGKMEASKVRKISRMTEYAMGAVSCAVCVYIFILNTGIIRAILAEKNRFLGMEIKKTGIFLEGQLMTGFAICMIFLIYTLYRILKYGKEGNWLLCLLVTNIFLLFQNVLWLGRMDTQETLTLSLVYTTVQVTVIGVLGVISSILIGKYLKKKTWGI